MPEETLEQYLGVPDEKLEPLVKSFGCDVIDPEEPMYRSQWNAQPAPKLPMVREVGEFIVDQLNRCREPFSGQWLICKNTQSDEKKCRIVLELQKTWADAYGKTPHDRVIISIRVRKARRWAFLIRREWGLLCHRISLRFSREETLQI